MYSRARAFYEFYDVNTKFWEWIEVRIEVGIENQINDSSNCVE